MQTVFDLEAVVQVRIVDQALPAGGGARLFKIDTHHQQQGIRHLIGQSLQALGIILGCFDVVNGAGANHQEQAMILAIQDIPHCLTAVDDGLAGSFGQGEIIFQLVRGDQHTLRENVDIIDAVL